MYCCLECGRKFKTIAAAERAADNGCPKCGGVDIDLDSRLTEIRNRSRIPIEAIDNATPNVARCM